MATAKRFNVTLDAEYAAKLEAMAARTHIPEGTLARSLLSQALDEAEPDPAWVTHLLDNIPGAWDHLEVSLEQARRGETIPLDELVKHGTDRLHERRRRASRSPDRHP